MRHAQLARRTPLSLVLPLVTMILVVPCLLGAVPAWGADSVDSSTRATARKLGYEGIKLYQAEDYRAATDRLERAYRMLKAPSLALWSARALEKSGLFVEASERYLEATRLPDDAGGEPDVQRKAREDAARDRAALLPRIPSLLIQLEGARAEDVTLTIGGADVSSAVVGAPRPTNPGTAIVAGHLGEQIVKASVVLVEGEQETVTLRFTAPSPAKAGPPLDPENTATEPYDQGAQAKSWQRPVGWITLGVGAAGLATGAIAGIVALNSQTDACPGGDCDPSVPASTVDAYNTARMTSLVGFIAGGILTAAGVTLVLTAPRGSPVATLSPSLDGISWGIAGTF